MTYNKKSIEDISISAGQKVFVRCDFNVPMKDGVITSDKRIVGALPTVKYLLDNGAKVILCSHMGKPHNIFTEGFSLTKKEKKAVEALPAEEQAAAKAKFLEEALEKLGLNRREANEFIVYWLPRMEQNPYNIIAFQTDVYTEAARLEVNPKPDTLIRVFMAWQKSDDYVELEEQELWAPERKGFTVVEWGGTVE